MSAPSPRDRTILEALVENCQSIDDRLVRFSIDKDVFRDDSALREMVLFPLLQIGELANHLSIDFTSSQSEIPWHSVVGLRKIVVNKYGTLDSDWVWDTLTNDLQPLEDCCSSALAENPAQE